MRSSMARLLALAGLFAASSGCTCLSGGPVELAPEDLNGIFHWMFVNLEAAGDPELADAAAKFHVAARAEALEKPRRGGLQRLSAQELAVVGMQGAADPSLARGFYVVTTFPCTLEKVERITYALDQKALYEGAYTGYARRYTTDFDAYSAGRTDLLGWVSDIRSSLLSSPYSQQVVGILRRGSRVVEQVATPFGPVLVVRIHLPAPAKFESSGVVFDQDYQVELYYERSPGQLVHGYGVWRHLVFDSIGMSTEDDSVVNVVLDNLVAWDEQTAKLCAR